MRRVIRYTRTIRILWLVNAVFYLQQDYKVIWEFCVKKL